MQSLSSELHHLGLDIGQFSIDEATIPVLMDLISVIKARESEVSSRAPQLEERKLESEKINQARCNKEAKQKELAKQLAKLQTQWIKLNSDESALRAQYQQTQKEKAQVQSRLWSQLQKQQIDLNRAERSYTGLDKCPNLQLNHTKQRTINAPRLLRSAIDNKFSARGESQCIEFYEFLAEIIELSHRVERACYQKDGVTNCEQLNPITRFASQMHRALKHLKCKDLSALKTDPEMLDVEIKSLENRVDALKECLTIGNTFYK